jgi:hypothetical protein
MKMKLRWKLWEEGEFTQLLGRPKRNFELGQGREKILESKQRGCDRNVGGCGLAMKDCGDTLKWEGVVRSCCWFCHRRMSLGDLVGVYFLRLELVVRKCLHLARAGNENANAT